MSLIEWHAPRFSWTIEVWQNEDKFESMFTGEGSISKSSQLISRKKA